MRPVFLLDCFTGSVVQDADIYKKKIKRQIKEQNAQKAEILKAMEGEHKALREHSELMNCRQFFFLFGLPFKNIHIFPTAKKLCMHLVYT